MAYSSLVKVRYVAFWASVVAALIAFGVIFVLTWQTPVQTCDLSAAAQDRINSGARSGGCGLRQPDRMFAMLSDVGRRCLLR